jgi:ubiquinone/menaquinone biosynthesis C-methylase UbiE
MNVLEWTYFLDNFEEVLDHGAKVFNNPDSLPLIDIETIRYSSRRYGTISAVKRAYRIPDDQGASAGWLVCLEPDFAHGEKAKQFLKELVTTRQRNLMWSEYAMSYDIVLTNTKVYPELVKTLLGEIAPLTPIREETRVLDLGAGTGNITYQLASPSKRRSIVAIDNNQMMLNLLREKCKAYIRADDGPGVLVIKQDITSLFGLKDEFFDYAILNNVLYAIDDPISCLSEVRRVLVADGEVRISGPKKNANLDILFKRIKNDLEAENGKLRRIREYYDHVERINHEQLAPLLRRFSTNDIQQMLREAGFGRIKNVPTDIYAKQSILICAWK